MKSPAARLAVLSSVLTGALAAACAVRADPDEAWLARASLPPETRTLLALILDRSTATAETILSGEPYDPTRDYAAGVPAGNGCDPARIYWRRGPGPVPDCAMQAGLEATPADAARGLHCSAARGPLAAQGFFIASRAAQWRPLAAGGYWSALQADQSGAVECRSDRGRHGAAAGDWYATDGVGGPWGRLATAEISWDLAPHADPYIFYNGNYLNFLRAAGGQVARPLAELLTRDMAAALDATDELEVALLLAGDGGSYVAQAPVVGAIAAQELRRLATAAANGDARMAGALTEAGAWLSGGAVQLGDDPRADPLAREPGNPGRYQSPFTHACRPIALAVLSAGQTMDTGVATAARQLQSDLRMDLPGLQSMPLAWVAPAPIAPWIAEAAAPELIARPDDPLATINLIARSHQHDAAVPSGPQLSAATIVLPADATAAPGVIFGLTAPRARQRWQGNLFRYGLRAPDSPFEPPLLVGRDGETAMDAASGLPRTASRSLWSDAPDSNLLAGGVAGRLPPADGRRLYSDIASPRIRDELNRLAPGNPRVARSMLGLAAGDPDSTDDVLDWLLGQPALGDPGLHAPLLVEYPAAGLQLVFATTHDGLLHAIDADTGVERWAWLPQELLPRLAGLMRNERTTVRDHGIDGPVVLHRHDPDGDGNIDAAAGEHLWLMFGLGRGGSHYYALDIQDGDDPELLWTATLPGADDTEAWAEPVITRLAIDGSGQSDGHWVVLLAGGYSSQFDAAEAPVTGPGAALHVVDAMTGRVLWSGGSAETLDLHLPDFRASLPSAPRALDLDGDGYLDRAYAIDVTGGLWRFEFASGRGTRELAQATVLAQLGGAARRFHATPDVSVTRLAGRDVLAVAVGSGWLARPRDASIVDRIYVVFDRDAGGGRRVIVESDLHDATDDGAAMPLPGSGWFRRLDRHGAGEKVIGPAITFDHVLRFQTYQPVAQDPSSPCGPPRAITRLHAIDIRSGQPQRDSVAQETGEDEEPADSGLPVALRFGFPTRWDGPCASCRPRPFGLIGAAAFDPGYAGDPVRTSWRKLRIPPDSR
ncbi:MAG: PilC/PilY family type IV pilus protein [Steroidobacteraceae bacterium]